MLPAMPACVRLAAPYLIFGALLENLPAAATL
eukprot:CAMPEP_0194509744 /NCGR_PEP_ID=MMETSP0253-20130528/40789_1 /TAXON_ID=2966 /ORGANISM="Noctiluca scintillans" /LENGTH=31 /DNA_ID= /DNA_START= /DNA_END= /DNA_ORIENTATION=